MEETLVITNQRGVDVTTSILVAKVFEKEHKHVLRDIEHLSCSQMFRESNFGPSSYTSAQGKQLPMYEITKDGFSFLVMGYIGEKASQFKETFINEFNKREALLKNDDYIISRSFDILQKRLDDAKNTIASQQRYITALKPQAEIATQFVLAYGNDSIAAVAKNFGYGRNEFFEILRQRGILQSEGRERNQPFSKHVKAGYFTVKFALIQNGQKTVPQTFVTSRGKIWLQRQLKDMNYQPELI